MLLRASGQHDGTDHNLQQIVDPAAGRETVPQAGLLTAFADAFVAGDADGLRSQRSRISDAIGAEAVVDAAGIVAIFNAVVRIADGTGIPLEDFKIAASADIRADLGIDAYRVSASEDSA